MGFWWATLAGEAIDGDERPPKAVSRAIQLRLVLPILLHAVEKVAIEEVFRYWICYIYALLQSSEYHLFQLNLLIMYVPKYGSGHQILLQHATRRYDEVTGQNENTVALLTLY